MLRKKTMPVCNPISFLLAFLLLFSAPALHAAQVCLTNGDCLNGKIIDRSESAVSLQHPILGLLTIPLEEIVVPTSVPEEEHVTVMEEAVQHEPLPAWKHKVFLALSGEEGNDVSFLVTTGFTSLYEDIYDRWDINTSYRYETEDRKDDESKGLLHITKDWLNPESPWLYYWQCRYHYDSTKEWRHRVTSFIGAGFDFLKDENVVIVGRLGGGGSRTWGSENRTYPEGQVGIESVWRPDAINELVFEATAFPDIGELGDFRTFSKFEWRIKFDVKRGLSIRSAIEHEYESEINVLEGDDKHHDLTYYCGLELEL